ncbi:MAG: DinB family protein [Bryobacteraceae bacterium]|jgi:DinB family protein
MNDIRVPNSEACLWVLRQTPGILRNLLFLATREQLDWRPSPERWSISMVLAHLAEAEIRTYRHRFAPMLDEDGPLLPAYDQMALFRSQAHFDPYAEMARFEEERGETLALLEGMPHAAGDRSGRHAEFGVITVAQLLNEFAFHDLGHIRQVMELYRAHVFYPEMGAYQGYYKIDP